MLSKDQKKEAINWYVNCSYSLSTIAQHYGITVEQLKTEIRQ